MTEFSWPVRVYYEDTDAGGVVFYANYLKFFERARTELLRSLGFELDKMQREDQVLFVVRSVQVDYLKPARLDDLLAVSATVIDYKKTSFTFAQAITKPAEHLCQATVRIACIDAATLKPKLIPTAILELLSR
ncbi:tol-pal system-associated acyl-CoA thioesterase [Methylomonas paludis]|uniref:Tol-pal system-associated acyl-CoA thioesterase n=1 Tax=Methylomonas paludis TaxID=1173101 RepID=A0A975MQH6_9GAMM|nr:tol-pal system-associated acyl-CoA thioesterase [Methylomonas paludis]QWF72055.1 tol-pal system-associated acyl-CoA thioesterase [Methylomonas paludis]